MAARNTGYLGTACYIMYWLVPVTSSIWTHYFCHYHYTDICIHIHIYYRDCLVRVTWNCGPIRISAIIYWIITRTFTGNSITSYGIYGWLYCPVFCKVFERSVNLRLNLFCQLSFMPNKGLCAIIVPICISWWWTYFNVVLWLTPIMKFQ